MGEDHLCLPHSGSVLNFIQENPTPGVVCEISELQVGEK